MQRIQLLAGLAVAATGLGLSTAPAFASSHREAPLITTMPKTDCADFYLFNSYEPGRGDYVTIIADYLPLQDAYGGPNYFTLDPEAIYEIHIDQDGDAQEDLTFQFHFDNQARNIALPIGPAGNQRTNAVPVLAVGALGAGNTAALNLDQTYTLNLIKGRRRTGQATPVTNAADGSPVFTKPMDNVGTKTIPDYEGYARSCIYEINIPGSTKKGRVFVGQRKDPFVVNLGETFDLINISTSPLGPVDANKDSLADKNVTSLILELPKDALTLPNQPIIGAWTTASKLTAAGPVQVSRLGSPLVNEVVIGLKDKDKFNAGEPKDDLANFADYVTHPTLPAIIELLYGTAGAKAPNLYPRTDLVAAFVTGVDGLNKNGGAGEMLRLNTAVPATDRAHQNNLGVIAGFNAGVLDVSKADLAGFPNGRRPGDDVVDIALRVVMGKLLKPDIAPAGDAPFTDGASVDARRFSDAFPYLNAPLGGSPNEPTVEVVVRSAARVQGPFQSVPATFDPVQRQLVTPKASPELGFYQLKANGKIELTGVTVDGEHARLNVK